MEGCPPFKSNEIIAYLLSEWNIISHIDCKPDIIHWFSSAPKFTTYRVNTLQCRSEDIVNIISVELCKQASVKGIPLPPLFIHPFLAELVVMGNWDISTLNLLEQKKQVIVDHGCAAAVLRGSHVFAPGVKSLQSDILPGDFVSVYGDINKKCTRGLTTSFDEPKLFVGNGVARVNRRDLYGKNASPVGIAVEMTHIHNGIPCLEFNCIPSNLTILQNLPSVLCCRILDPQPGEVILDMCAAPGNKTTLLAMLMNNEGILVAFDKTNIKVQRIKDRCEQFSISCVHCFQCDATKNAVISKYDSHHPVHANNELCGNFGKVHILEGGPPFKPGTFERILLDAPCSGLGQRPQIVNPITVTHLKSYPPLQRKLFESAVSLLQPGGCLVYSTCTITAAENECIVQWALEKFSSLELKCVNFPIGGPGLKDVGLTDEQRYNVRRFGPPIHFKESCDYNCDTVGFFIACFIKK